MIHVLLLYIYPNQSKLIYPLLRMSKGNYRNPNFNSEKTIVQANLYAELRKKAAEASSLLNKGRKGNKQSQTTIDSRIKKVKDQKRTEEQKLRISLAVKGKRNRPQSPASKAKIGNFWRGKPKPIVQCPHCGKMGGFQSMKRWHYDNCPSIIKNTTT